MVDSRPVWSALGASGRDVRCRVGRLGHALDAIAPAPARRQSPRRNQSSITHQLLEHESIDIFTFVSRGMCQHPYLRSGGPQRQEGFISGCVVSVHVADLRHDEVAARRQPSRPTDNSSTRGIHAGGIVARSARRVASKAGRSGYPARFQALQHPRQYPDFGRSTRSSRSHAWQLCSDVSRPRLPSAMWRITYMARSIRMALARISANSRCRITNAVICGSACWRASMMAMAVSSVGLDTSDDAPPPEPPVLNPSLAASYCARRSTSSSTLLGSMAKASVMRSRLRVMVSALILI